MAWDDSLPRPFTRAALQTLDENCALGGLVLREPASVPQKTLLRARLLLTRTTGVFEQIQRYEKQGYCGLVRRSPNWPDALRVLRRDEPHFLFAKGNLKLLKTDCVAVAGSRIITKDTVEMAARLGRMMANEKLTMVCGGAEATILPTGVAGFSNMKALSSRNDEPQRASRPYDVDRDGFVMGEGAGVVILETLEHAQKRGAKIYGELVGYGISADAYHLTAPDPEGRGAARCMKMALEHAGMKPEDIDYVNTHGTSTPLGDICEIKAIKAVFGDHAKNGLLISSTKSMTGHLLGAAGGVELAACLMAMQDNIIPPTINVDNQDPECDLDCVPNKARETRVDAVLSNSFGFGGHNSSVIVKRFA